MYSQLGWWYLGYILCHSAITVSDHFKKVRKIQLGRGLHMKQALDW